MLKDITLGQFFPRISGCTVLTPRKDRADGGIHRAFCSSRKARVLGVR